MVDNKRTKIKKERVVNHYNTNQSSELPKVLVSYTDSNKSFSIECVDYDYNKAFEGCLFLLDKRLKNKDKKKYKDSSVG